MFMLLPFLVDANGLQLLAFFHHNEEHLQSLISKRGTLQFFNTTYENALLIMTLQKEQEDTFVASPLKLTFSTQA